MRGDKMALKNGAIIFSANPREIDDIIDQFSKIFDVELIHCETSYSKLWVSHLDNIAGGSDGE